VCLVFFGLLKNVSPKAAANIWRYIIQPLDFAGFNVEAILVTHNASSFANPRNHEADDPIDQLQSIKNLKKYIMIRYFTTIEVEDSDRAFPPIDEFLTHGDPWPDNPRLSVVYFLRQLYSLKVATTAFQRLKDNYVGAVYLRPDLVYLDNIDTTLFKSFVAEPNQLALAVPSFHGPLNDRFAFGNTKSMLLYGSRGDEIYKYSQTKQPHAETFLNDYAISHQISVTQVDFMCLRVRANGQVEGRDAWMMQLRPPVAL
jgi:hypothetical protein